jgi:L-threonylcarbamoyladenylate synthase
MVDRLPPNIQQQIEQSISILRQGGLVAYPTDTVYGLGVCASNRQAVERVYRVKERPRNAPLPLLLANITQITELAEPVSPLAWLLIHSFLPGALTIVLLKSRSVPDNIAIGATTIAIRIPAHPVPVALIKGLETPIVGTSANLSGRLSPLTAEEVYFQLDDRVDLVIDDGRCPGGKESTVVDVTGPTPVILREGAISSEEIEQVCRSTVSRKDTK